MKTALTSGPSPSSAVLGRARAGRAQEQTFAIRKHEVAPLARFAPFFARNPSTVISVPGCSDVFVKPRRNNVFGVPPSIIHLVTVPSGFFTSRWIHECGLIHSIWVTAPRSVTGWLASNSAANEWCARSEPTDRRPRRWRPRRLVLRTWLWSSLPLDGQRSAPPPGAWPLAAFALSSSRATSRMFLML